MFLRRENGSFAGAFDERIALTIAQEPGGGGAAAWRVPEPLGEVEILGRTSHAWFKESMFQYKEDNVSKLPYDHHELCGHGSTAALLVLGNPDYVGWLMNRVMSPAVLPVKYGRPSALPTEWASPS